MIRVRRLCLFVLRTPREVGERELRQARLKIEAVGGKVLKCIVGSFLVEGPPDLPHTLAQILPRWRCTGNLKKTPLDCRNTTCGRTCGDVTANNAMTANRHPHDQLSNGL